jgi:hypothetical protein
MHTELPIPKSASSDINAREILRVWGAHGHQHTTIDVNLWDDPGTWGIVLADLARHVCEAMSERRGMDSKQVLARIVAAWNAEICHRTE